MLTLYTLGLIGYALHLGYYKEGAKQPDEE